MIAVGARIQYANTESSSRYTLRTDGHRNWYFEAGCSNVFNKGWSQKTDITAKDYLTTNWSYSDSMDPQFYVKVSYSFDFGRKLQHTKPMEFDSKIDDGIMMPD